MANSSGSGRRLNASAKKNSAKDAKGDSTIDADFAKTWNETDKYKRRQIRRLVRIGRPQENAADARLAGGFAAYQRSRLWFRYFWFWLVPITVAGVVAGMAIHPIVIGAVLAIAANALIVRRAFKKADWLNEPLLDGSAGS